MKRFRLELVDDDKAETVFEGAADKPVGIGRSQTNAVVLRDPSVSKRHAVIEEGPDGLRIRDTGSLNGTKRGGEKVSTEGVIVAHGDQLRIGKALLRLSVLSSQPSPLPSRPPHPPTPQPPKRRDEPVSETFGPYGIIRPLDAHGTEVHLAVDSRTKAQVALKRMPSSRFGWFGVKAFLRACEAARTLRHENLVAPCDVGKQGNTIYVAFPYVAGVTVEAMLRDTPRAIGIELAIHIAREVSRGLAHLEQDKGAAGRPEVSDRRVMVGAAGQVVLLGAGVPRLPEAAGSTAARYVAPEEDAGRKGDMRSAIFALGVLLYEMLTQEPIDAAQKVKLRGVDTVRIEVPTGVGQTTMRSMKVRPEARYDTAAELEGELGEALEELNQRYGVEEVRRWLVRHYPDLRAST